MQAENFTLVNTVKAKLPRLAFAEMKNTILGADYDLTVTIVSQKVIQTLNREHRQKDEPTDILSFPLDHKNGEIYINLECAAAKAKEFDRPYENFLGFLFIHGLVHLKGIDHGSTMERIEAKFRKQFGI